MRSLPVPGLVLLLAVTTGGGGCAPTSPENPSFPLTPEQASEALEQMRANPKSLRRPLVVVGGYMDCFQYQLLKGRLEELAPEGEGGRILPVSLFWCDSFADCRKTLIEAVDQAFPTQDPAYTTEVDVVGVSLGGLTARYAAGPSDDPAHLRRLRVARLFTISSPHQGSDFAGAAGITQFHKDLSPGSPFLLRVAQHDAEAGYRLFPYVMLGDRFVGQQNTAPPGDVAWWVPGPNCLAVPHLSVFTDDRVVADIGRRLRQEKPFATEPRAPLPAGE